MGIDDYIVEHTKFNRLIENYHPLLPNSGRFALITSGQSDNHAPSIDVYGGVAYLVWFSGSEEGNGDVAIYLSTLNILENPDLIGSEWTEPQVISHLAGYSCQNPIIIAGSNILTLYHSIHPGKKPGEAYTQEKALVVRRVSQDGGLTWSLMQNLFDTAGFFPRAPPIKGEGNDSELLFFPVYHSPFDITQHYSSIMTIDRHNRYNSIIEYPIPDSDCLTQPCLLRTDCNFQVYLRDRRSEWIYRSTSPDSKTWSPAEPTEMVNNNSGIAFIYLGQDRILGLINPTNESIRSPITVVLSLDNGVTWHRGIDLDPHFPVPAELVFEGYGPELSYPTIAQDKSTGDLHMAYTYCHGGIKWVQVDRSCWEQWFITVMAKNNSLEGLLNESLPTDITEKILDYMEYIISIKKDDDFSIEEYSYNKYIGYIVTTSRGVIKVGIDNEQNCCENFGCTLSYNGDELTDSALNSMFGSSAINLFEIVESVEMSDTSYGDEHNEVTVTIKTNLGTYEIKPYNDHNGYYSHEVIYWNKGSLEQLGI